MEVDGHGMNGTELSSITMHAALLAAHVAAGFAAGVVFFQGLWWTTRRLSGESSIAMLIIMIIGRVAMLAGLLTMASFEGAQPLLALASGLLAARFIVVRRVTKAAP